MVYKYLSGAVVTAVNADFSQYLRRTTRQGSSFRAVAVNLGLTKNTPEAKLEEKALSHSAIVMTIVSGMGYQIF